MVTDPSNSSGPSEQTRVVIVDSHIHSFGRIARQVAHNLANLFPTRLAYDPYVDPALAQALGVAALRAQALCCSVMQPEDAPTSIGQLGRASRLSLA